MVLRKIDDGFLVFLKAFFFSYFEIIFCELHKVILRQTSNTKFWRESVDNWKSVK